MKFREEEERLRKLLEDAKRDWKKNQEQNKPIITGDDVGFVVSKITGIPLFKLEEEESEKLLHMEEFLHKRIVGQEEAISAISRAIRRSRAGLKEAKKPIGSFIFPRTYRSRKDRACSSACRISLQILKIRS